MMKGCNVGRRGVLTGGLMLGGMLLPGLAPALAGPDGDELFLRKVNPQLRPLATALLRDKSYPPLTRENLAYARTLRPPETRKVTVNVQKRVIAGAKGHPDVVIHIVNADPARKRPAILHTHGGGFVLGSAEASVPALQDICLALDCLAVTVEYRLAPETTYAGSIEDNYASLKWLHAHASEIGADPGRIGLLGESAGGGHAAILAITARDRGEVPLVFQCLIQPMLDDRTGTSNKVPPHIGRLVWTPESNMFGWSSFLGREAGGKTAPKGAVPARVDDLRGLPPTFIGVGSLDLFVNENIDYARRLINAEISTEIVVVPGAFHGFDVLAPEVEVSKTFAATELAALRKGLFAS